VRRGDNLRFWFVIALLVGLQFSVRSRLGNERIAPDFLLLALLTYTIRSRPGQSAAAGFIVGLIGDALTPASFGAGALAHTIVGYLSSWAKAVFFADNLLVNGGLFFAGTWLRNAILVLASGKVFRVAARVGAVRVVAARRGDHRLRRDRDARDLPPLAGRPNE
jgi:rod shape-determining protein MreD